MKKLFYTLIVVSIFMVSCGNHFFNPNYYYMNRKGGAGSDSEIAPPDTTPDKLPDAVEEDKDPFKNGEWNKPDYGGYNADKFNSWLFKASFQGNKLPIYNFFNDNSRSWISGGQDWNNIPAYYYKGIDGENTAQGYKITKLTVYKYEKNNPLWGISGYLPGRLDRFNFYSINGESGVGSITVPLKQYLIAVDTYSKFVFAFGAITDTGSLIGQVYPTQFEAIERHGDKKDFYEYDPIGYVDSTGNVIFYQHYITEFVANPTGYSPKQHGYDTIAEHNKTKPGRSPYVSLTGNTEANEEDKKKYEDEIKKLVKEYKFRDYSGYQKSPTGDKDQINLEDWKKAGYLGLSLTLYTYNLTDNGNTLTIKTKVFNSSEETSKTYKLSVINTESRASYTNINDNKDSLSISIVKNDSGNNTVSISGRVLDANFKDYGPIFVDRAKNTEFKYNGSFYLAGAYVSTFVDHFLGADIRDLTYKFNSDGTEFTMSYYYKGKGIGTKEEFKTHKFKLARFDSSAANTWTAKYECTTLKGTLGNYTRVVLRNGEGRDNPGPDEIGTVMRTSMTLHSIDFYESPTINTGLDMIANRRVKP